MPDDASGNFSLVSGYLAVTGQVVQPSNHNPPLEDIAAAMTNRISRSGVAPMTGPLKTVTGSASVPAIYPNSNPAIGIYWTPTGIGFAGSVSGVRFIGELIPYTFLTAPALTVFPYGQTLLRASYPDLWALAQTDIAAGNTFYNNGNGTTTFGIGDMRGRIPAGKDDMGGTSAGRIALFGANATILGSSGGQQTSTLVTANLPPYTPSGSIANGYITISHNANIQTNISLNVSGGSGANVAAFGAATISASQATSAFTGTAQGGTSTPVSILQPMMLCNYLLYAGA